MSLNISRTTEPLRFDVGIGAAGYADVIDSPASGQEQKALLPGATTVSQAVDSLFPTDQSVGSEILAALVAANPPALRTASGFDRTARGTLKALRGKRTDTADAAAAEIETLLADADLFERCRLALLET
ncbi:MAG: hypothetical protein IKQ55_05720 [Kiritimatiellae bacterium]|nr:hypothetical protein [Kiritimatiellia bacterium]